MSGTIIISTWGSPFRWGCADYVGDGISVRSCCTLPYLTTKYKDSDVILVVLDSLIDVSEARLDLGTCGVCSSKCLERLKDGGNAESYDEVEARVKGFTGCVVECIYKHDCECNSNCRRPRSIEVIVGPSLGSPGGTWTFKGNVGDFTGKVFFEVGAILDKKLNGREVSTIVLDVTHGINFMPAAMLSLAERVASLIMVRQRESVKIEVYNSDPYPPRAAQRGEVCCRDFAGSIPTLNMNLIESRRVERIALQRTSTGKLAELPRDTGDPHVRSTRDELDRLRASMGWARRILISLYYPLPLMLVYSCNDTDFPYPQAGHVLDSVMKIWKKWVKIDGTSVDRIVRLHGDDIYALLLASFTCKSLEKLAGHPNLNRGVDIDSLRKLEEEIYGRVSPIHKILIGRERSNIENLSDKIKSKTTPAGAGELKCTTLAELKGLQEQRRADPRIMIAHTGFQDDFTELCINENNTILLRYSRNFKDILEETNLLRRELNS